VKAGIVDYGMGNLASVSKALEKAGADGFVSGDPAELKRSSLLVLPGVGNLASGMANLAAGGLDEFVREWAAGGKPLLGICLGMQMLFDESEEGPSKGLGILPGRVEKLNGGLKVPHMGWNTLSAQGESVFRQFDGRSFYFVHSYVCVPAGDVNGAKTNYGRDFVSALQSGSVAGVQFHPEKSSKDGIALLERTIEVLD
jgi:glutamine amidotransferase